MNNLEKLMYLRGVATEYYSFSGDRITVPWDDRLQLLRELGDDPCDEEAIKSAVYKLDAQPWLSWLQTLHIISKESVEYVDVRVRSAQLVQTFSWKITTEQGDSFNGEFIPTLLEEVGDYYIDTDRYSARRLKLNNLPLGYHQISIENNHQLEQALLIVTPDTCFKGNTENKKIWGINCQLYTLRSERNWGIGDFTDLLELIELAAAAGIDLISLNPLHAPYTAEMDFASPYSPSDRRFLNPLYIDPEQVVDFYGSKALHRESRLQLEQQLSSLRNLELVDYDAVARLKYSTYDQMFRYFLEHHIERNSKRAIDFQNHVEQQGQSLAEFTHFETKQFGMQIQSAVDPQFHQYLQWLAEQQLSRCQQFARRAGMSIGLMKDLAIGAVRKGAEVQGNLDLYCLHATIGAPPDPLAEHGQNWDLPAPDPTALKASKYQLFIDLLRANMRSCGGLRIDHILGLLRLWWCHPDIKNGAYVYYPMDDLLAILCLESQRNSCLVVGEDMGTVPDELRAALASKSIYSNKLFYFEKQNDQSFKRPQSHQSDALLMITNHDVSTLAGWWDGTDLKIRQEIGLISTVQEYVNALTQRHQEKHELLNWLQSEQLLPQNWDHYPLEESFDFNLCAAILSANARSQSKLLLFQLDDLQLLTDPVNIPGTYRQYPNWRRKQKQTLQTLFNCPEIQTLFSTIHQERMQ